MFSMASLAALFFEGFAGQIDQATKVKVVSLFEDPSKECSDSERRWGGI